LVVGRRICLAKTRWNAPTSANSPAFDRANPREDIMKTILRATALCVLFAGSAVALTAERMAEIPLDKMSPAQRSVADAIMTGPRKSIGGPFNAWLRTPELADRLQKVGEYIRFNTSLDKRVNEMAIIMTAHAWGSQYEWYAHAPLAIKAGLDPAVVAAIGAGKKPDNMKDDEAIVWEFSTQLRRDHGVDDAIYARALEKFGEKGIMDLVAVNGYYDVVSMTLNVARVAPPAGEAMPFQQAGQ
jgi:4-carboxymuconolactone decarboxylase